MNKHWNIAGLEIPAGEKVRTLLIVPGTDEQFPATFINGSQEGKTLLVNSGLHGGEYVGIQAAIEMGAELNPTEISGQMILVHPLSLGIFLDGQCSISLVDQKNPNRIYPPDPNGSLQERIAAYFWKEIVSKADFFLDMHSGGFASLLYPHAYLTGVCSEETFQKAKAAGEAMGIPYLLRSRDESGAFNYAGKNGIPGICAERGYGAGWSKENKDLFKKDIRNLMRHLDMLKSPREPNPYQPQVTLDRVYEETQAGGCWYADPAVELGKVVQKGQKLGEIRDYFGNLVRTVYAQDEGVILILSPTLSVRDGYVAFYAKYAQYV